MGQCQQSREQHHILRVCNHTGHKTNIRVDQWLWGHPKEGVWDHLEVQLVVEMVMGIGRVWGSPYVCDIVF